MEITSVKDKLIVINNKIRQYRFISLSCSFLWLFVTLLVFFLAVKPYLIYLIINIVLTLIYGLGMAYSILNIHRDLKKKYVYVSTIDSANINKEYLTFVEKYDEKVVEGIKVYRYKFINSGNEERILSSFDELKIEKMTYYLESKIDYIVTLEVYHEEEK